ELLKFHVLQGLESRRSIVRQSTISKKKEVCSEGKYTSGLVIDTNMLYSYHYAKQLGQLQRLEIMKADKTFFNNENNHMEVASGNDVVTGEGSSSDLTNGCAIKLFTWDNVAFYVQGAIDNLKIHHNSFKMWYYWFFSIEDCNRDDDHCLSMCCSIDYKMGAHRDVERNGTVDMHGESKALNDSDEDELYENLIKLQLKDIDMKPRIQVVGFNEKVVHENQFQDGNGRKDDHVGLASHDWEVSDVGLQAVGEEEEDHEIIVEDPFHWEENEKESVKASKQDENDKM
nr:hypothetical protein [Tanacetum cinerariifolium]